MTDRLGDGHEHRQALSALADGELDPQAAARLCAAWREDASLREAWHATHLVGDVLRSDDLASPAGHDDRFLARLRERLAQEPVVLAPQPAPAPQVRVAPVVARRGWAAPFAVAAGFVAVAGVLVATRVGGPQAPGLEALTASSKVERSGVAPAAQATDAMVEVDTLGPNVALVRDAHLDRYLAAHRQFGSALAVPGAGLRNAAAIVPER